MLLRVSRNGDVEIGNARQAFNQVRRVRETVRVRLPPRLTLWRVTAQSHEVTNTLVPILPRNVQDLASRSSNTSQVRCPNERGLALNTGNEVMSALTGGAIRAI